MLRRAFLTTTATSAVVAGIAVLAAAPASAHECFVVNRSEKGNQGAAHSENWAYLTLDDVFYSAPEILGAPPLTAEQQAWAVAEAEARGIPASFAINTRHMLPVGDGAGLEGKGSDGAGIDHFFSAYSGTLEAIYAEALMR